MQVSELIERIVIECGLSIEVKMERTPVSGVAYTGKILKGGVAVYDFTNTVSLESAFENYLMSIIKL